ncbi:PGF-CTERM sorting domain-containing protein [Natrinema salsiterrestre]|uniref:PGF-CTERM sorting domain-containing protein n=1 Tax=Natrinema salsiterrestre TaxID=2950540 RepID=A0A9Q4KZ82_9EURY|nr:PGF-CTERM sorting domain-containing protein [Natrinema salsiterrestre]MDF9744214.1 PGF-CTERM sorting domain-containing protein [Natrinema salsiterrestre]
MAGKRNPASSTRRTLLALGVGLAVIASLVATGAAGASAAPVDPEPNGTVSEEAYLEPAPEPGDPYFEAAADDGSWVSYENPRDEYRTPYLGDGSGKICVTLVNENGKPVIGESVPNTSVTIPTNDATSWHPDADPMTVEFPMNDHYQFPLDGDQFGTHPDVAQGDGYMDSHCIEFHGFSEDATVEYGEAQLSGEHADRIDVAGYIQQIPEGEGWDTDIDPVAAAEPYEEAGGGWTYDAAENATHAQVTVVLQLEAATDERPASDGANTSDSERNGSSSTTATDRQTDESDPDDTDEMPGFGVAVALLALSVATLARYRD